MLNFWSYNFQTTMQQFKRVYPYITISITIFPDVERHASSDDIVTSEQEENDSYEFDMGDCELTEYDVGVEGGVSQGTTIYRDQYAISLCLTYLLMQFPPRCMYLVSLLSSCTLSHCMDLIYIYCFTIFVLLNSILQQQRFVEAIQVSFVSRLWILFEFISYWGPWSTTLVHKGVYLLGIWRCLLRDQMWYARFVMQWYSTWEWLDVHVSDYPCTRLTNHA